MGMSPLALRLMLLRTWSPRPRCAGFKTGNDQDLPKELVSDAEGALVKRATDVSPGGALTLRFAEGTAEAVATGAERCVKAGSKPQPKAKT